MHNTRTGRSEKRVFQDPQTGHELWQMTCSDVASFHSYYDLCPWSRDGSKIVFSALPLGATEGEIYWLDAQDGTIHWVGHSGHMDPHQGANQQWLGPTDKVAYTDRDADGACVRVVDLMTGDTSRLDGTVRMVAPDGQRVAGHTNIEDEAAIAQHDEAGVFISDIDGGSRRRIVTLAQCIELNPLRDAVRNRHVYIKHTKWAPSGDRLFFVFTNEIRYEHRYNEERVKDIYVVNADGSDLRWVCSFTWGHHPAWSSDNRHILLNDRPDKTSPWHFLLVNADTGQSRRVTDLIEGGGHPSFSPDGRRIAVEYVKGWPGEARVVVVDLEHGQVEDIARPHIMNHSHQGTHIHPTWSHDGRYLLFNSDQSGHAEVIVAPMGG